ncbi:MAG: HAD family hydrolase [Calditrichia bacterium]
MNLKQKADLLLLFDIDGTLISTNGEAGKLMLKALEEEIQRPVPYDLSVFIGSTDRYILRQFIVRHNGNIADLKKVIDRVMQRYLSLLEKKFKEPGISRVLPGVDQLLDLLSEHKVFSMGLLTGNVKKGAYIKLQNAGLDSYFPVGAFGDDNMDRNKLAAVAIERAQNFYRKKFLPENVWIIGDSPKDILCAKTNGLKALAVASGWHSMEELSRHQPDVLLPDLGDTRRVVKIFTDEFKSENREGRRYSVPPHK